MLWFVCRKIGLFSAIFHRKNVFCEFEASHFDFYLILLETISLETAQFTAQEPKHVFAENKA